MKPTKRYDVKIDLSADTVHTRILNLVGEGKRVLDVGCSTGNLARALTEVSHCAVTGIEIDPGAAEEAKSCCERVVLGDIESMDLETVLAGARFDVIIFADVLEHLVDPWRVLADAKKVLADGFVVASLPNVAHAAVVLELLRGRFQYRTLGLLDDSHLRFFGKWDVVDLFEKAGYAIESFQRVYVAPADTELGVNVDRYPAEFVRLMETNDEATTYQFVVKARVAHGDAPVRVAGANSAGERGILGHIKLLNEDRMVSRAQAEAVQDERDRWRQQAEAVEEDRARWRQQAEAVQEDRDRWRRQAEAAIRVATELEAKLQAARSEVTRANANPSALAAEFEAKLEAATSPSQVQTSLLRQRISITARLNQKLLAANHDKSDYERQLQQIFRSRSWRLTAPIRFAVAKFRRLLEWAKRRPKFRDVF